MHALRSMIAVAALAVYGPAHAEVGGPEVLIYRLSGVAESGGAMGVTTAFHCTNFSGITETVRVVVRSNGGALAANAALPVPHLNTAILSTHNVSIYLNTLLLTDIFQGTAAIAATSVNVTCTAMQVQTNVTNPVGIALHMTRFNPVPGSQE